MPFHHILAAVAVAALWGCNFVSAKVAMGYLPPMAFTAGRFALTAALLLPFAPRPTAAQLKACAELAFILGTLHFALMFGGLRAGLDIASASITTQLGVPFSCLFGAFFLKDRIGKWRALGLVVAFSGVAVVAGRPDIFAHPLGFWLTFFGALAWGASNIRIKQMGEVHIFTFLAYMSLLAVPLLVGLSALIEQPDISVIFTLPVPLLLALSYTVLGSTIAGYGLWYWLMRKHPVSTIAPYALLTPVFGIAAGQAFYGEALTAQIIAGGMLTILGVGIITLRRPKLLEFGKGE